MKAMAKTHPLQSPERNTMTAANNGKNLGKTLTCPLVLLASFLCVSALAHPPSGEEPSANPSQEQPADIATLITENTETTPSPPPPRLPAPEPNPPPPPATHTPAEGSPEGSQPEDPQWGKSPPIAGQVTVLHGLDKITARVFALEVKHDQPIRFGTLRVTVRGCKRTPPEEPPESAAFLEITEEKKDEAPHPLFSGWMFASRPSISALEHPVYDIWVTECLTDKKTSSHKP